MGFEIRKKGRFKKAEEFTKRIKEVYKKAKVVLKKSQKEMKKYANREQSALEEY